MDLNWRSPGAAPRRAVRWAKDRTYPQLGRAHAAAQQAISGKASQFCDRANNQLTPSRHLGERLGHLVEGAALPEIVEMAVEKAAGGARAELVQPLEEIEIIVEPAVGLERLAQVGHLDAMQPDAAAVAAAGAARQPSLVDQLVDQSDGAQLRRLRGPKGDLVGAAGDLAGVDRHLGAGAGLICTISRSSAAVARMNGSKAGLLL
jgi:hypothetical protein